MKISNIFYPVVFISLVSAGIYYRADITDSFHNTTMFLENLGQKPCSSPIPYSIGDFDPQFGVTEDQFLADVNEAAQVWQVPFARKFFRFSTSTSANNLKINLTYDYRQQATDQMTGIGITIKDNQATYDQLKAKYSSLNATYISEKANFTSLTNSYNAQKATYDQEISYWNSHGGAPKDQYNALEQKRQQLNASVDTLNSDQEALNSLADTINSVVNVLNRVAAELNQNVGSYNAVSSSTGEEFDEGEYVEDSTGHRINIYQYDSHDKLVRVLAHELGHALGLQHVADPNAIMYAMNQGTGETLTKDDINELKQVCGIKD